MQIIRRVVASDDEVRVIMSLSREDLELLTQALDVMIFDTKDSAAPENVLHDNFARLLKYLRSAKKKRLETKQADTSDGAQ